MWTRGDRTPDLTRASRAKRIYGGPAGHDLARTALEQIDGTTMLFLKRSIREFLDAQHEGTSRAPISVFEKEGAVWLVGAFGAEARVKDALGMGYLKRLISSPGVEMHVTQLAASGGDRESSVRPEHSNVTSSDIPLLDDHAKKDYARRIRDLEEEIEEAQANYDDGRAARLQEEKDAIIEELRRAAGLGGKTRVFSNETERARISVTKAIRRAIGSIRPHHAELATHLEAHVTTGTFCSYSPSRR